MPNHVRNTLTVIGPARDVATFVLLSQTPPPRTGDVPLDTFGNPNINYTPPEAWPFVVPFHFHGVVPLPGRYGAVPYSHASGYGPDGYTLETEQWGVKWGPYDLDPARDIQIQEHLATYHFTTAWWPPERYYVQAARRFSTAMLAASWGGEGPCRGRALYSGGRQTEALIENFSQARDVTDVSAWVQDYLMRHDAWVASLLALDADLDRFAGQKEEPRCSL